MTDINQSAELGPPLCISTLQGTDRRMDGYPYIALLSQLFCIWIGRGQRPYRERGSLHAPAQISYHVENRWMMDDHEDLCIPPIDRWPHPHQRSDLPESSVETLLRYQGCPPISR